MDISKLLQPSVFRDIASYIFPGIFFLIPLVLWWPTSTLIEDTKDLTEAFGAATVGLGALVIAYVVGFLISSLAYILWRHVAPTPYFANGDDNKEVMEFLRQDYADLVSDKKNESALDYSNRLVQYCYIRVRDQETEGFLTNIERLSSMKNFEIGLSFALVSWAIVPLYAAPSLWKVFLALAILGLALYFLLGASVSSDSAIDDEIVSAYARLRKAPSKPDVEPALRVRIVDQPVTLAWLNHAPAIDRRSLGAESRPDSSPTRPLPPTS